MQKSDKNHVLSELLDVKNDDGRIDDAISGEMQRCAMATFFTQQMFYF